MSVSTITKLKHGQNLLDQCRPGQVSHYHILAKKFELRLRSFARDEVRKFWLHIPDDGGSCKSYKPFLEAVYSLAESCKKIEKSLDDSKFQSLREKLFDQLRTQILSDKPHYLGKYLQATYMRAFKVFRTIEKQANKPDDMVVDDSDAADEEDDDDVDLDDDNESGDIQDCCTGCGCSREHCDCELIYLKFCKMNEFLRKFGLLEDLVGDTIMNVSRTFIERRVSEKGKSNYSQSYFNKLTIWVHGVVKKWISQVYGISDSSMVDIGNELDQRLKIAYAKVRVAHLFEIILEYPDSEPAIQDLKIFLDDASLPDFRRNLIDSIKQSLIESLLHAGVNTYDILTAYISAIKALRFLDPGGLILQMVTEPVRRYLKSRDDTVRCIVTALTDDDHNSELNREMIRSGARSNENGLDGKSGTIEMNLPSEGEKCTAANFEEWKPDSIELSSSDDQMKSSRFSDIVSILVNIYETKDLFVEEYQKLLSQRLLNKYDECNLDTELRNLELLTIRFSDCELHRCEVMLKDVQTSKRINKRILSGDIREHKLEGFRDLDVLIVSSPFWPDKFSPLATVSDEPPEVEFPPEIESAISTYTKAFESIQASRTLHWRHHLGSVNLDLTIGNKTQNFSVSPLHAAILYLFKEKKSWKLSELMHKTLLPAATLRSRLALWQRNGIIRDSGGDKYDLINCL